MTVPSDIRGIRATDAPHPPHGGIDLDALLSARSRAIDASGIRRVFDLGATLENPINLSIGQPDFPVPEPIKRAAVAAIEGDHNGYTPTQGLAPLRQAIRRRLEDRAGWAADDPSIDVLVTSGTSGGLLLAAMALLEAGDEIVVPDPYFVMYPQLGPLTGGRVVTCSTYPDFRLTAERVEPLLGPRTKAVLLNSPSNPCGIVATETEVRDLVDLCRRRGVLLISDEIYDEFVFDDALEHGTCPTPARFEEDLLLIGGFGKTYACTGWRLGYAAGPKRLIAEMAKMQQYTFVCAPTPAQHGVLASFDVSMRDHVEAYARRRDLVLEKLSPHASVARPGGAFYAFVEVPRHLGMTGTAFVERAVAERVLTIPGAVFSERDTHFRLSFATAEDRLVEGLEILARLLRG
ncbi:MAG: pyridoxal phosphate-dependent aminotransferase [Phycisphaerales bacterium]|jgi:aspartate/methionine/tyrosine aminotransferase